MSKLIRVAHQVAVTLPASLACLAQQLKHKSAFIEVSVEVEEEEYGIGTRIT